FIKTLAVMTGLLAIPFAIVALISNFVLAIIYGDAYSGATLTMQILLAAVFAFSITLVANAYLITTGETSKATMASLVGLVVGLGVMFGGMLAGWAIPLAGSSGVLAGYTIALVITVAIAVTSTPRTHQPRATPASRVA
ncbi:MAG: O-antigen/teichoic acid export rane protein, partial [Glaciihabitans sp.]|nr:O-antigen/teichoic acid export rane protein [Glaciihabitans sp.]